MQKSPPQIRSSVLPTVKAEEGPTTMALEAALTVVLRTPDSNPSPIFLSQKKPVSPSPGSLVLLCSDAGSYLSWSQSVAFKRV